MRLRLAIAGGLASGLLLWASAPPVGLGWLAWVALVPAAAVVLGAPATRGARIAVPLAYAVYLELLLVPALPFGLADRQWGDPVLPVLLGGSPVLFAALVGVPLVALALYALRFPQLRPEGGAFASVLIPALAWTALDLARTKFDPSGLWGPLFLSQHETVAARLSALAGPWLVTFVLVAFNFAVALVLVRRREALPAAAAVAAALVGGALAAGVVSRPPSSEAVRVAAVQPGFDTAEFELPVLRHFGENDERASLDLVRDLEPLTREAAREGAKLVVWPEATIWVDPVSTPSARRALRGLARETGATLVVPYFLREHAAGATVVVTPRGTFTRAQPKQRPMWFLGEKEGDRVPAQPVETSVGRLGTMLGVDNKDPAVARALAAGGAEAITSSTHDWAELAPEQKAFSQLSAAALGVPLVRADWRYGSAISDAGGGEVADAGSGNRRTVVVGEVTLAESKTVYARIGDVFGWTALAGALAVLLARLAPALRRERAQAQRAARAAGEGQLRT